MEFADGDGDGTSDLDTCQHTDQRTLHPQDQTGEITSQFSSEVSTTQMIRLTAGRDTPSKGQLETLGSES